MVSQAGRLAGAIPEGQSCARLEAAGPYVAAKRCVSSVLAAMIEGVLQHYLSDANTQSYVTIRLTTPYTQARRSACEAHLLGGDFDAEALWSRLRDASTVSIWVETYGTYEGNTAVAREAMGDLGDTPTVHEVPGPNVERVAFRRGKGPGALTMQPVAGGGGVEYEFPATALQGEGPFYVVIHAASPEFDAAVKLKRSIVRLP
jgi:hypothetical protein